MLLGQVHFLNFNFFCFHENCILWYDIFAFCWTWFRLTQLCCQGKKCFLFWLKLCLPVQIQSMEQDYVWVNLWHATSIIINMLILPHNCQNGVLIYHCWQNANCRKQEILFNQSKKHKTETYSFAQSGEVILTLKQYLLQIPEKFRVLPQNSNPRLLLYKLYKARVLYFRYF